MQRTWRCLGLTSLTELLTIRFFGCLVMHEVGGPVSIKAITYYTGGKKRRLALQGLLEGRQAQEDEDPFLVAPQRMGAAVAMSLPAVPNYVDRFQDPMTTTMLIAPADRGRTTVLPTPSIVVEGATARALSAMSRRFGLETIREGSHGKLLLRVPGSTPEAVFTAAAVSREFVESGDADAAHPNFIRVLQRPERSPGEEDAGWNMDNNGGTGAVGADVHALAAWTVTKGDVDVRVAVLDEGVDTGHVMLRGSVREEADFVAGSATAAPSGNDAHGTACAGIICSSDGVVRGIAPECSLVAARIAKSDELKVWIFDDFDTADAIDWCWDHAEADVLSNSWGGGAPSDAIIRAIDRARTQGRDGKGSVVVFAAGNTQQRIGFPGNLPGVLTVGASNQWDERKTKRSQDGEDWWGSNFGPALDVMAPGVSILTTDITGPPGYDPGNVTGTFNGTSAATPHVAGTAALMLSVRPDLTEDRVRGIICATADPIGVGRVRNDRVGHGRLNAYKAVREARRG